MAAVSAVPRTLTGKKLELPVTRILRGADPDTLASKGSPADPESLAHVEQSACDR
jgi:acetoacetyl-CoA synthetase